MDRIRTCLWELASDLATAQRRDVRARDDIYDTAARAPDADAADEPALRERFASNIDEMANAAELVEESVGDAARDLNLYAAEAGAMWLTKVRVTWYPGMPEMLRDNRMPPEEVLLRHHQPDDPGGMVDYYGTGMTATEAEMLGDLKPWDKVSAKNITDDALAEAQQRYPPESLHNGHGDAWRHAYWTARLAGKFGDEWAEDFTTAHEGAIGHHPTPLEDAMDLHNNQVGLRIANENPDASPEELGDLIEQAAANGELVVIAEVDGELQLVYTDQVPVAGTG